MIEIRHEYGASSYIAFFYYEIWTTGAELQNAEREEQYRFLIYVALPCFST